VTLAAQFSHPGIVIQAPEKVNPTSSTEVGSFSQIMAMSLFGFTARGSFLYGKQKLYMQDWCLLGKIVTSMISLSYREKS
jgi:hypothetical protein